MEYLVLKYEIEARNWVDELNVPMPERISLFEEVLSGYAESLGIQIYVEDMTLAKFLYCNFLFADTPLNFDGDIVRAKKSFQISFGRLELIQNFRSISATDALFIAQGVTSDPIHRLIVLALLTEYTRKSRVALAMELSRPINLGTFNILLAALRLTKEEYSLHKLWIGKSLPGEVSTRQATCDLGTCAEPASWLVICPHGDGREYMCTDHKRSQDLDFSTYRLMFTNSCGHYAERRDCTFIMVGI